MRLRSLMGSVFALALPAHAVTLTETDFLADLPVVLTVSKMAQPLHDSPSSVTIIDQDMIRASGYRDIPDLLRLVPGFSVAYTRSNQFAVAYHGLADAFSRRFQVLVDGRSIYNPNFGEVNWGTLPLALEDIERIEVVRGPNAAVYGANAFFAVINIISKDPSQTRGRLVSVLAGEQNMAGAVLRYGGGEGDLRYRFTLSSQHRDRFEKNYYDPGAGSSQEYYERTYTRFFNGRWDYQLSNTDELSAQVGLTGGNWNAGNDTHVDESRAYDPLSAFAQLRFSRAVSADEGWAVQFSHSYETLGKDPFMGPFVVKKRTYISDVAYANNLKQWRTQLDFSSAHRLNPGVRLVWGGELRHEAVQGEGYYGTSDTLDGVIAGLFAHAEWRPAKDWLMQGGAHIAHHYFTGVEVSPRLAVSYNLNLQNTLRLAASRATRSPTFYEQKGNKALTIPGAPPYQVQLAVPSDLKPEVNTSIEIGYLGQWPRLGAQLDVRVYRDHLTDYIGDRSTIISYPLGDSNTYKVKYFKYYNGGTVDVTGLDAQLTWKPHRDFSLHFAQSFAHIDASRMALDVDDDIPESGPDWITSVLANWRLAEGLELSTAIYRTDRMFWLHDGDVTRPYTRVDVRLARQFKLDGMQAEWALGVQNAGDDYEEFRRQNLFSRRAYGTLKFAW